MNAFLQRHTRPRDVVILFLACFIAYASSLSNGFALDDVPIIRDNRNVHDLSDATAIWLKPYWPQFGIELGLWRPLVTFAFALQWAAGGGDPLLFHVVSVVLHACVTILAYQLLRRLVGDSPAFVGALLFAVHPVHTEAVANIVGQGELLAALFVIGACGVYAGRPDGCAVSRPRQGAVLVLFACAILTKEHAVVLPGLLLLIDIAQRRIKFDRTGTLQYVHAVLVPLLLLGCVLALYLTVRYSVLQGHLTGVEAGPQHYYLQGEFRLFNALRAFPEMLRLLLFPADLSADYSPAMIVPVESLTPMAAIGAVLLGVTVVLTLLTARSPEAGFPAGWFLLGIVTVSNLFFPVGVLIAERTLYLASFGLSAAAAYVWVAIDRQHSDMRRTVARILFATIVAACIARTAIRNPDWRETRTLVYSIVRDHPESYKAQWTLATYAWEAGKLREARAHFQLAMRLYPHDSLLTTVYANFLLERGDVTGGLALLEAAYRMHPYITNNMMQLASAYITAARYTDALQLTHRMNRQGVPVAETAPISAVAHFSTGNIQRAVGEWRYAIQHSEVESAVVWAFIARPLAQSGFERDAMEALDRGLTAAIGDAAATAKLNRIREAVQEGCYARPNQASCDPLGAGLSAGQPAQSASVLHNASRPPIIPPRLDRRHRP